MPTANELPRPDSTDTGRLLDRAAAGDAAAVGELLMHNRPQVIEFVEFHLSPAVRGRLDASDVVQDAQAEIARRLNDYLARRPMPFHLWARKTTYERLLGLHRNTSGARRRAVGAASGPCRIARPWRAGPAAPGGRPVPQPGGRSPRVQQPCCSSDRSIARYGPGGPSPAARGRATVRRDRVASGARPGNRP